MGKGQVPRRPRVDFAVVNRAALSDLAQVLLRWLPDGHIVGHEFVARNPTRADRHPGSFKINMCTGQWADFATGDRGGDPVSLIAYLDGCSQVDAALHLSASMGFPVDV